MKKILGLVVLAALIGGCSNATMAKVESMGSRHHVQLYSGGKLIGEWTSTGAISNEENSDGFYFQDENTGKLIRVSGDAIVTQQ